MLERFIVSRKAYDHDMAEMRGRISEITKQLRDTEKEKGEVEESLSMKDAEVGMLHHEIKNLRKKIGNNKDLRSFALYLPDVPEGETQRREYMAQVAGFFEGGLKDKLNYMHLQFRNQTGMFPLTERETDFFRACINVVGLLLDWGEECVNEHRSNIANVHKQDEANVFDDSSEAIENIKRTVTSE